MTGKSTDAPIALIGGTGALPSALVAAMPGRAVLLCELMGFAFERLDAQPKLQFRLEHLAEFLGILHERGVREVCFAGAIRRPTIDPSHVSTHSAPLVEGLVRAMRLGDDGALRAVIALFEASGFAVIGAATLAPALLPPMGALTQAQLPETATRDIGAARVAHDGLAFRDEGQAVVVRAGKVLATEGPEGTDAMLAALTSTARDGLLYKAPKAAQDLRADLPVIGPATVRAAAQAGLSAIVITAGGVMVLDRAKTVTLADAAGLNITVVP